MYMHGGIFSVVMSHLWHDLFAADGRAAPTHSVGMRLLGDTEQASSLPPPLGTLWVSAQHCLSLQVQQASPMPTSFLGSALRGTFFFIFGLWWSVRYPLKYLRQKPNAESQPRYGVQRAEVFEGAVKAFFALAGKRR